MEEEIAEEILEIDQTWQKVKNISRKTGLREGISNGRESNFQEYFDMGFREGFKNGYALGKYKGALFAHSQRYSLELVKYPLLEKVSRGRCEACKNEHLLEENVLHIITNQSELSNRDLNALHSTFNKMFCIKLPEKLLE